jgi:hypothetical protein
MTLIARIRNTLPQAIRLYLIVLIRVIGVIRG